MNKQKSLTNIFGSERRANTVEVLGTAIALSSAVLTVILRVLAYFFYYDKSIGYFVSGNPLSVATYILTAIGILAASLMLFLPSDSNNSSEETAKDPRTLSATLLAIGACLLVIINHLSSLDGTSDVACVIAYLLACVYFATGLIDSKVQKLMNGVRVICGYALLVGIGISVTDIYFNRYIPMNNPDKVLLIFTLLFNMLYLTAEYRYLLGMPKRNLYVAFSLASMLTGFSFSLSYLIAYIFGALENDSYLVYAFSSLMFSLYVLIKFAEQRRAHRCAKGESCVTTTDNSEDGYCSEAAEQVEPAEACDDNSDKERNEQ